MSVAHHLVNRNTLRTLAAAFVATMAACAGPAQPPRSAAPPLEGTVLILIDTLRADHLGCYGSDLGLTPVLDGLAAHGTLYEDAVAPSSWTRSSVASLFASRYPSAIGVLGREDAIAPGVLTLAEVLHDAGFETLAVSTNRNAGRPFGFAQGFDRFEVPDLTAGYPDDFRIHVAEGVTLKALQFLDDRSGGRPFFLFLHYVDPHDPYLVHPEPGGAGAVEPPGRFDGSRRDLSALDALPADEVTDADRARIRHLYAGEVRYCDRWIGELLRGLEERGLRDRVQVVITADHGEGLWDHGDRGHGRDLYQEQIHVPLIFDAPETHDGDRPTRVTAPVSLLDVAPAILAAHGIEPPGAFRGSDLAPLARGERRPRRLSYLYTELDLDNRDFEALRHGASKLIRDRRPAAGGALELYDLAVDPGELDDLAAGRPPELARLERTLDGVGREVLEEAQEAERVSLAELDEETADSLRALGYLAGPGPRGPARRKPEGLSPVVDFELPDHRDDQLVSGFYELENGRRWMSGAGAVVLGRSGGEQRWRVSGWIDLALHGRRQLTVTARADGGESQRRTIDHSGFFTLEGPLPAEAGSSVRLELKCDHEFVPARPSADRRRLCVVVRSIELL